MAVVGLLLWLFYCCVMQEVFVWILLHLFLTSLLLVADFQSWHRDDSFLLLNLSKKSRLALFRGAFRDILSSFCCT